MLMLLSTVECNDRLYYGALPGNFKGQIVFSFQTRNFYLLWALHGG